jgi:hypothetical protein
MLAMQSRGPASNRWPLRICCNSQKGVYVIEVREITPSDIEAVIDLLYASFPEDLPKRPPLASHGAGHRVLHRKGGFGAVFNRLHERKWATLTGSPMRFTAERLH